MTLDEIIEAGWEMEFEESETDAIECISKHLE